MCALQQQVLLQRPPHLRKLESSTVASGPAALSVEFSRPMERTSVAMDSQLKPALAHQWLGSGNLLRLLLRSFHWSLRLPKGRRDLLSLLDL